MKTIMKNKTAGFYLAVFGGFAAIISIIRYVTWAPSHNAMNEIILAALLLGIIIDVVLIWYDNDYLLIAATAFYSISFLKLLVDSVGSFVDAFQGINMFGDSTQVSTIISISCFMAVSVIMTILASFMKRVKA